MTAQTPYKMEMEWDATSFEELEINLNLVLIITIDKYYSSEIRQKQNLTTNSFRKSLKTMPS